MTYRYWAIQGRRSSKNIGEKAVHSAGLEELYQMSAKQLFLC